MHFEFIAVIISIILAPGIVRLPSNLDTVFPEHQKVRNLR